MPETLAAVRARGDAAVRERAARRDRRGEGGPEVSRREREAALDPGSRADTGLATANLRAFAEAQIATVLPLGVEPMPGVHPGHRAIPIERVGCPVPGGRCRRPRRPSCPPAWRGVDEVVARLPTDAHEAMAAGCDLAGADPSSASAARRPSPRWFAAPGACPRRTRSWAPATHTSKWPSARSSAPGGVGQLALPSETHVPSDASGDAETTVTDPLAQAEPDMRTRIGRIATDDALARAVEAEVERRLGEFPTAEAARRARRAEDRGLRRDRDASVDGARGRPPGRAAGGAPEREREARRPRPAARLRLDRLQASREAAWPVAAPIRGAAASAPCAFRALRSSGGRPRSPPAPAGPDRPRRRWSGCAAPPGPGRPPARAATAGRGSRSSAGRARRHPGGQHRAPPAPCARPRRPVGDDAGTGHPAGATPPGPRGRPPGSRPSRRPGSRRRPRSPRKGAGPPARRAGPRGREPGPRRRGAAGGPGGRRRWSGIAHGPSARRRGPGRGVGVPRGRRGPRPRPPSRARRPTASSDGANAITPPASRIPRGPASRSMRPLRVSTLDALMRSRDPRQGVGPWERQAAIGTSSRCMTAASRGMRRSGSLRRASIGAKAVGSPARTRPRPGRGGRASRAPPREPGPDRSPHLARARRRPGLPGPPPRSRCVEPPSKPAMEPAQRWPRPGRLARAS